MDSSHKATLSNYPSVFTVLLRVAVFEIHPALLSTEQADLGRGWGEGGGMDRGEALLLSLNCCWNRNSFVVSVKRIVARRRGRHLELQTRYNFRLSLAQSRTSSGQWFNIHMPWFLPVRSSQPFQPTRNCLTKPLLDGED